MTQHIFIILLRNTDLSTDLQRVSVIPYKSETIENAVEVATKFYQQFDNEFIKHDIIHVEQLPDEIIFEVVNANVNFDPNFPWRINQNIYGEQILEEKHS